jgi:hypothetical protein
LILQIIQKFKDLKIKEKENKSEKDKEGKG